MPDAADAAYGNIRNGEEDEVEQHVIKSGLGDDDDEVIAVYMVERRRRQK